MAKAYKNILLFSTIILTVLLFSSVYATLVPNVHAAEASIQQESMAVADNVIGVDLAKYPAASEDYRQDLYLDVIPQENLRYTLETNESKIDIQYTFVKGKLQKIHVLDNVGSPQMRKALSDNALDLSKDFLSNYQSYTDNAFYGELKSTLDTVEANKNVTAVFGNKKLSVTTQEDSTTYRWVYTINGIEAPAKCVALKYENGFLKYFIDNWDLYKIGSTAVNVSEEQAIDVGMARAMNVTWSTTLDNETFVGLQYNVTGAMIWKTVFTSSLFMDNSRDQDPLMLYPMRHIWVRFDKFYPCYVYGMKVYVWADTGEIAHSQLRFLTMDPPADSLVTDADVAALVAADEASAVDGAESSSQWEKVMLFSAFVFSAVGAVTVYSRTKKARSSKIGGTLLCVLMISTATLLVAVSVSVASALPQTGQATIWGSECSASYNPNIPREPEGGSGYGSSWRKAWWEVDQQRATSVYLETLFDQNGYYGDNSQGTNSFSSNKGNILNRIEFTQDYYPRVAIVDFDHGNGENTVVPGEYHFMFEDQRGTFTTVESHQYPSDHPEYAVFDYEIYPKTDEERNFFTLINACNSACIEDQLGNPPMDTSQGMVNGRARGMPFAWTHREVENRDTYPGFNTDEYMSDNGYARPDYGDFVYLGFNMGSAALSQPIDWDNTLPLSGTPYHSWLEKFFEYALMCDISVNDALDEASQWYFNADFDESPLGRPQGFMAQWPLYYSNPPEDPPKWWYDPHTFGGSLKVYGNGLTKLYQPQLTLSASNGLSPTFTLTNDCGAHYYGTGGHRLISDWYSVSVTTPPGYEFSHFTYQGGSWGPNPTIQLVHDEELKAYYTQVSYNLVISVNCPLMGSTTPSGTQPYPKNTYAQVTANPNSGYVLNYWKKDVSENLGNNPTIKVYMDNDHTLQAVFGTAPSYKFISQYYSSGGTVDTPENIAGWQPDGYYAVLHGYGPYGVYGWTSGKTSAQTTGHIYMYGCCISGGAGHLYVYVSNDGSNWTPVSSPYVSSTTAGGLTAAPTQAPSTTSQLPLKTLENGQP
jgi:hypothetical protein